MSRAYIYTLIFIHVILAGLSALVGYYRWPSPRGMLDVLRLAILAGQIQLVGFLTASLVTPAAYRLGTLFAGCGFLLIGPLNVEADDFESRIVLSLYVCVPAGMIYLTTLALKQRLRLAKGPPIEQPRRFTFTVGQMLLVTSILVVPLALWLAIVDQHRVANLPYAIGMATESSFFGTLLTLMTCFNAWAIFSQQSLGARWGMFVVFQIALAVTCPIALQVYMSFDVMAAFFGLSLVSSAVFSLSLIPLRFDGYRLWDSPDRIAT